MSNRRTGVLIVGGGLAGQRCAEALRRHGYAGPITIVCGERHRPYDRPPLSKEVLDGSRAEQSVAYRPLGWYDRQSIDLVVGLRATGLDAGRRRVTLSDATTISYRKLVVATGSRPRTLPVLDGYDNVTTLRTLDDSRALRDVLAGRPRLAVIGAGFIGQEIASCARKLGCEVTMIEAGPSPLARILGPRLGEWFAALHRAEGVDVLTGRTVERVLANGAIRGLALSGGRTVAADHVVVGVGVAPDVDWLAGSGLPARDGIPVDPHGHTVIDGVFAVGDAAATFDRIARRYVPGSHWEAAARQGARAARAMLGLDPGAVPVTSFWTDQYGIRIQYLGRAWLGDAIEFDGDPATRSFAATFTRAGRAVAALLVNRPRSLPAARELIEKGTT